MKVIFKLFTFSLLFLVSSKSCAESEAPETMPAGVSANEKSGAVIEVLGKDQFNNVVLQSSKPVVVKFGAPWCPACTRSKAPYAKIATDPEFAHITFVEMDFDKNSKVAQDYDVQSLPTFLYFKDGKLGATKTGFSENLKEEIRRTVASLGEGATVSEPAKKNEESAAAAPATSANQEEVSGPACAAASEGGFLQSISNFFTSVWNTVTGWFK